MFQSSPAPKDGCNLLAGITRPAAGYVSILTRPEGRVQLYFSAYVFIPLFCFNPHPPRRTGATISFKITASSFHMFQSSPAPKDGCNLTSLSDRATAKSFNPHPPRRTGATCGFARAVRGPYLFQSSPAPKDGCNLPAGEILHSRFKFQSSPAPKDGCNQVLFNGWKALLEFQSSPAPKDGCNASSAITPNCVWLFQSSPAPKDGCNILRR